MLSSRNPASSRRWFTNFIMIGGPHTTAMLVFSSHGISSIRQVTTPTFSALAVVNGPVVPGEGLPVIQRFTTCTWTISLSHVKGTVPISVADFDSIDHLQTVFTMTLVPGQPPLPTSLHTGQSLSFKVRAVMPTGEGLMRWAPDGNNIVAKWDYQVEND